MNCILAGSPLETKGSISGSDSTGQEYNVAVYTMIRNWPYLLTHIFCLLWMTQLIQASMDFTIGVAVSEWYFGDVDEDGDRVPKTPWPVFKGIGMVFRYHMGSLAFGSFIVAAVQMARLTIEYIDEKTKGADSKILKAIMCMCKACLWCLECCLKFITRQAYLMMAITGENFCGSAKKIFFLNLRNIAKVTVTHGVTHAVLFFGKVFSVGLSVLCCFFIITGTGAFDPSVKPLFPCLLCAIIAYLVANIILTLFSTTTETLLMCFLVDSEVHGEGTHGPESLRACMEDLHDHHDIHLAAKLKKKGGPVAEQLRAALKKDAMKVTTLFKEWDDDESGSVTRSEFRRGMEEMGLHFPRASMDEVFDEWDPDGSGELSLSELEEQLSKPAPGKGGDGLEQPLLDGVDDEEGGPITADGQKAANDGGEGGPIKTADGASLNGKPDDSEGKPGMSKGRIAVIVAVVLGVVALLGIAAMIVCWRGAPTMDFEAVAVTDVAVVGEGARTELTMNVDLKVLVSNPNNFVPATVTLKGGLKGRRVQGNSTEGFIRDLAMGSGAATVPGGGGKAKSTALAHIKVRLFTVLLCRAPHCGPLRRRILQVSGFLMGGLSCLVWLTVIAALGFSTVVILQVDGY